MAYALVALFGGLVGIAELLSRYKDAPASVLRSTATLLYIGLNALVSVVALKLVQVARFEFSADPQAQAVWQVIVAGFSGALLLRSSIMNARVGDRDVQTGPAEVLNILLSVADRQVDRQRALKRSAVARRVMAEVDFRKAMTALPAYCFQMMQNVSDSEQQQVAIAISELDKDPHMDGLAKSLALGLTLMTIIGEEGLAEAVDSLGQSIR